jgi:microcystin-dependent protein
MPFSPITPLPPAPQRNDDPDTFAERADVFVVALETFSDQLNVFKSELETAAALIAAAPAYADAGLVSIAGLDIAADEMLYGTGANTFGTTALTSVARTLLGQPTQALMRTTGLGMSANGSSLVIAADYAAMRGLLSVYSTAEVDSALAAVNSVPTGSVHAFAMDTPPAGYLKCDGSAVSRTTYAALFAAIGTVHGVGNGSTTFNLPDLRGEFIRGWDDGRGVDSGRAFGSFQADELKAHTHTYSRSDDTGSPTPGGNGGHYTTTATSSTGGVETRPRNIALLYAIKT